MTVQVDAITKLIDEEREKPFTPYSNGRMTALIDARRAVMDAEELAQRRTWAAWEELGIAPS